MRFLSIWCWQGGSHIFLDETNSLCASRWSYAFRFEDKNHPYVNVQHFHHVTIQMIHCGRWKRLPFVFPPAQISFSRGFVEKKTSSRSRLKPLSIHYENIVTFVLKNVIKIYYLCLSIWFIIWRIKYTVNRRNNGWDFPTWWTGNDVQMLSHRNFTRLANLTFNLLYK